MPVLRAGNGQKRHHFHGFTRKDREVWMGFEHLGSGFMRSSAHDHENGQLIGNVRHAISRSALGFAKGPALVNDGLLMLLHPGFPGGEAFLFFCAPFVVRHGIPGLPARTRLVAEEDGEISVVCAEACAFPLRFCCQAPFKRSEACLLLETLAGHTLPQLSGTVSLHRPLSDQNA